MVMKVLYILLSLFGYVNSQSCLVNLDCDSSCLLKYGTNASRQLVNIFQKGIYPFKNHNIKFKLNQIRYHPDLYLGDGDSSVALQRYRIWNNLYYPDNTTCLNILFTHSNDSNIVGVAYINGKCNKYNIGLVKINSNIEYQYITMGHEIGHLLGLDHDCELRDAVKELCNVLEGTKCVPTEHPYIMYPRVMPCSKNINKLSPCSAKVINHPDFQIPCLQNVGHTQPLRYNTGCEFIAGDTRGFTITVIIAGMVLSLYMSYYYVLVV
jgi:hypothetical protein